jgi:ComF family protein
MVNKYPFEEGYYGFYFEGNLREAIHAFKFKGRKEVGRYLVKLIADKINSISERFDVIIPIPVTEKRLKERGFNQSFIIAEEIGRITGSPVYPSILYKRRDTEDQFLLDKDKRRTNLKDAFAVKEKDRIKERMVLLIDDLFTTGATAREATGVILKSGVKGVIFFALARTP